ncbi:MAG: hypothetical protein JO199_00950, partial [Candidatus Eremiobacteraeota bacterium]|nr:hypothetical protein [Candidatus Eremiobacteraeota bacterium]
MKLALSFALWQLSLLALTALPAVADLGDAKAFAVLNTGGALNFGSGDVVGKPASVTGATCPAGTGCAIYVGGTTVTRESTDTIDALTNTDVAPAATDARNYSAFLSSLKPTQSRNAIVVRPGFGITLKTVGGLNVFAIPSIALGNAMPPNATLAIPRVADPCGAPGRPAQITLVGTNEDTAIFNIGTPDKPGALVLCGGSTIRLSGGITPDRVTFNVAGKGLVALGSSVSAYGTILAPGSSFVSENSPAQHAALVDGALIAGGSHVTIGNSFTVRFDPSKL